MLHGNVVVHCVTLADAYSREVILARRVLGRYVIHMGLGATMQKREVFVSYVCHASSMLKMALRHEQEQAEDG